MRRLAIAPNVHVPVSLASMRAKAEVVSNVDSAVRLASRQSAALIREEGFLLVWSDQANDLIDFARRLEAALLDFVWSDDKIVSGSPAASSVAVLDPVVISDPEKNPETVVEERPRWMLSALSSGTAFALLITLLSFDIREFMSPFSGVDWSVALLRHYIFDGHIKRFALLTVLPFAGLLLAFPCSMVVQILVCPRPMMSSPSSCASSVRSHNSTSIRRITAPCLRTEPFHY